MAGLGCISGKGHKKVVARPAAKAVKIVPPLNCTCIQIQVLHINLPHHIAGDYPLIEFFGSQVAQFNGRFFQR